MNETPLIEKIQKSFTTQATEFETDKLNFTKQEYLDDIIRSIGLPGTERVLEVASGTCACGRAIAPYVHQVTCVDATPYACDETGRGGKRRTFKHSICRRTC